MNEAMQRWEEFWKEFIDFEGVILGRFANEETARIPKPKTGVWVENAASEQEFYTRFKKACEEKGTPFFELDCRTIRAYSDAYNFMQQLETFGKPAVVYIRNFTEIPDIENRQPTFHLLVNSWKNDTIWAGDIKLNAQPLFVFLSMREDNPNPYNLLDRGWLGWAPMMENAEGKLRHMPFPAL